MLDEVRPYLIADGGNVRVMGVDVESRVVSDPLVVQVPGMRYQCFYRKLGCVRTERIPSVSVEILKLYG